MKALIGACALCGLIWLPAVGQRGGGPARPAPPAASVGIPPLRLLPPMATASPALTQRRARPLQRGTGSWYPGAYDDDRAAYVPYEATPSMVVVLPDAEPAPPPRIVQGEVHEYTAPNPAQTGQSSPAEFAIVGKDHVSHPAVAVWAQGGTLHYLDADGAAGEMPLSAVDREATRQANSAKGLRVQLSAE